MLADDLLDGAVAAADYTGLEPRQIYHLADRNLIPVIRIGKKLFFRKTELDRHFSTGGGAKRETAKSAAA